MIIITRVGAAADEIDRVRERVEAYGVRTTLSLGERQAVIGCLGNVEVLPAEQLARLPGVARVERVSTPYKRAARAFAAQSTIVRAGDEAAAVFGGEALCIVAGPCSVEGRAMLHQTAAAVRDAGAGMLRGGAFKPRTSPYAFQGLGQEALELLAEARAATGLPVVTEVMDTRQVEAVAEHADMLQVGARNMQNYPLLAEVGRVQRPILLKRGLSATIMELLLAAEYIMSNGNAQVVLCERGIRTFETATRNTLDVAAIPVLRAETHLPVIVDPSHAGGRASLVAPLAFAAVAAGADGLIVEVHPRPEEARSDAEQSLSLVEFEALMKGLAPFAAAAGRRLDGYGATDGRAA